MASSVVVACRSLLALVVLAGVFTGAAAGSSKSFNITNSCSYTVWPAISSGTSSAAPYTTGFELAPGQWEIVAVPSGWSGRVWGRTLCSTDSSGRFTCVTGDCGSGRLDCVGGNAVPPATLAEFMLHDGSAGMDSYDVSLVDGFNLPLLVAPAVGGQLRVAGAVACKIACVAFGLPQYCCTGEYGTPRTCKPSSYSELFKKACPRAYSYAHDGTGSTFTCAAGGDSYYSITFCPSTTGGKHYYSNPRSEAPETTGNLPLINSGSTTPYTGGGRQVGVAATGPWRVVLAVTVMSVVTAVLTLLANWLGFFRACSECVQARRLAAVH